MFDTLPGVERSMHIVKPYRLVAPEWPKSSTVVHVLVSALSSAALAAGADGLLVEVHPNPPEAWCDADQALTPTEFVVLMDTLQAVAQSVGRTLDRRTNSTIGDLRMTC